MPIRGERGRRNVRKMKPRDLRKSPPATSRCRAALRARSFDTAPTRGRGIPPRYCGAVEIEHEGTVVVLVIMRTQARLAVVLAAGGDGRPVEGVDRGARGRRKGHMDMPDTQA